jgi:hypothetical protein
MKEDNIVFLRKDEVIVKFYNFLFTIIFSQSPFCIIAHGFCFWQDTNELSIHSDIKNKENNLTSKTCFFMLLYNEIYQYINNCMHICAQNITLQWREF